MVKSLMVVPYISNKTLPRYFQYLIEGYSWQPELIRYYPNDFKKPVYQNYLDYKVIDTFTHHQPTDLIIYHASDIYLMVDDLRDMVEELLCNENAFCIGIDPITNFRNTTMNEEPVIPARVGIWKANIFMNCLNELKKKKDTEVDEIYRMGEIAIRDGYKCLISKTARAQRMLGREFKVASLS